MVTDISALKRTTSRLEAIIKHSPVGIALLEIGAACRLHLANDELVLLSGLSREDYEARYGTDYLLCVFEEDRLLVEQALSAAARQRRPADITFRSRPDANGHSRWLTMRAIHLEDTNQGTPLLLGIISDITQQRQAAAEISWERQRYLLALELTGWSIWEVDLPSRTPLSIRRNRSGFRHRRPRLSPSARQRTGRRPDPCGFSGRIPTDFRGYV